jgi:hypothetical protein
MLDAVGLLGRMDDSSVSDFPKELKEPTTFPPSCQKSVLLWRRDRRMVEAAFKNSCRRKLPHAVESLLIHTEYSPSGS